jgi:hypothetical protein
MNEVIVPYMEPVDVKEGDVVKLSPFINKNDAYMLRNVSGDKGFTCLGEWMRDMLKGELKVNDVDNTHGALQVFSGHSNSNYWVHRTHVLVEGVDY